MNIATTIYLVTTPAGSFVGKVKHHDHQSPFECATQAWGMDSAYLTITEQESDYLDQRAKIPVVALDITDR